MAAARGACNGAVWAAVAWLVGCAPPALAVDPSRAVSQYVRERWGPERGFPRGPVYAIAQTPDGYLWIGTEAGLVRFDGLNFQLMKGTSTPVVNVLGLTVDRGGDLWVRLPSPTLLRYRDGAFTDAMVDLGMPYSNLTAMSRSHNGGLVVGRLEDGTVIYESGKFGIVREATPVARSPVISVAQTAGGDLWLGTRDAGLYRAHNRRIEAVAGEAPDTKINCLLPEAGDHMWVGTDAGLARWDGSRLATVSLPGALNRIQVLALLKDRDGNLWVGAGAGGHELVRVNAQGAIALAGLGGRGVAVTALFEDREGSLWIGSANGIERLRDSAFVTYSHPEGVPAEGSHPVYVDAANRVWFPPATGGLWWMQNGERGQVTTGGLGGDVIYSIAGGKDELWLGRQRGGLTRLRVAGRGAETKTYTRADGLAQDSVYSVHQARDGTVWAGTLGGGVSQLREGKFSTYTTASGLASNTVSAILQGADGTMWFATPNGLSGLSGRTWRTYDTGDGLPSANVNTLFEDSRGVLWVGTADGIAFRGASGFERPGAAAAPLREQVFGIAEDRAGWLWIATSGHVVRARREKLMGGSLADGDWREYGFADGLRGMEGVKRHRSMTSDASGRIWISLNHGIAMTDPARLESGLPVPLHVHTISADGVAVGVRGAVRVPGGTRRLTLSYAGLSLAVPERIRFRYRLDDFDRDWNGPAAAREAGYTNLGPGTYRFRLVASNPDGLWNREETTLRFEIAPLYWQTWWFRLAVLLSLALTAAAAYRYRMRVLTGQLNARFEERLGERTRIAQELHDTLLQGFLSASMQLHVAAGKVGDESPAKATLNRVQQLMGQVIEEGRNAVRGLRSSQSASLELEQAFCQIPAEAAAGEDMDFRVITAGQPRPLHPVLRDDVYRIGREALVNAYRHAKARSIEVEIDYGPRQFRLSVRDNGCGIDASVLKSGREGHWGLPGMRERAESIGARLNVWSSAAAGTEVVLSVPAQIAYLPGKPSPRWRWLLRPGSRNNGKRK